MDEKEFLNQLGINATKELTSNPKINQIVKYMRENNKYIFSTGYKINSDEFIYFINNMNSIENIVGVLNTPVMMRNFSDSYKKYIKVLNIYNIKKIKWYGDYTLILADEEYLENATVEWTQDVLFKSNKIIKLSKDRVTFKENTYSEDDYDYISPIKLNLRTLNEAKTQGRLKEVLLRATKSM